MTSTTEAVPESLQRWAQLCDEYGALEDEIFLEPPADLPPVEVTPLCEGGKADIERLQRLYDEIAREWTEAPMRDRLKVNWMIIKGRIREMRNKQGETGQ